MMREQPRHLIGVDEAGYGPNLGPLVISATLWRFDSLEGETTPQTAAWQSRFRSEFARASRGSVPVPSIDDSKKLYSPRTGIGPLESVVLAVLQAVLCRRAETTDRLPTPAESAPTNWDSLCAALRATPDPTPWHESIQVPLPLLDDSARQSQTILESWRRGEDVARVTLQDVRAEVVFPASWNREVRRWNNKATALSMLSLTLVQSVLARLPTGERVGIACDKHGGRKCYAPLLMDRFSSSALAEVVSESSDVSRYRLESNSRNIDIEFRKGGESELPVALASMVAKYVREVSMRAFNAFWLSHQSGLRPTAGYPVDARRFRDDTESTRHRLGIPDEVFWRER